MENYHIPVLRDRSIDLMQIGTSSTCVDVTFGGGGHSRAILDRMDSESLLVAFDQDSDTLANLPDDPRLLFVHNNFRYLRGSLRAAGIQHVDAILADLGVSSHHFDCEERGFSFRFDAPLDMRMNREARFSARALIAEYSREDLTRIFREYGELDNAYRLAGMIVTAREQTPIETVNDLTTAIQSATPRGAENKFYAKLFQALRIEVNGELEALKMMLEQSLQCLRPGGRLVVITYHSLEDRLVKNFMRSGNFDGEIEKDFYGRVLSPLRVITPKPIVPDDRELSENSRSRSAKLRCAEKL